MKIYCSKDHPVWNLIPKFIGKNVWVRCYRYNDTGNFISVDYVKFLSEGTFKYVPTPAYNVCAIPESVVKLALEEDDDYSNIYSLAVEHTVYQDTYDIANPFKPEVYPDDELQAILRGDFS